MLDRVLAKAFTDDLGVTTTSGINTIAFVELARQAMQSRRTCQAQTQDFIWIIQIPAVKSAVGPSVGECTNLFCMGFSIRRAWPTKSEHSLRGIQ
jgi:hypothetical protein